MGKTRARKATAGVTLDTGALIALDRGVLGQAWRDGRVQVTLGRFLRSQEVEIVPLDEQLARACGELCGAANMPDIIDASVVILARERQDRIVTSDPHDLRRLDPAAPIIAI